ncbi:MAG TPA: chemotaxis protein CheB [Longimicrobium sp.]|nr:chemotaxis protein CheB [Longimicrobium sp.]
MVPHPQLPATPGHAIIVIGASSGGVAAVLDLVGALPADLPAAVFVVVHCKPDGPGLLADLLARRGALPAEHARDGERIVPGRIYVAPPDFHLLLRGRHMHLRRGPKENYTRPAVDPLFRTAALSFGPRVIGVVLTGNLDDGTAGLFAIARAGGVTVVQDPAEAPYPGMPANAVANLSVDHVLPLERIAPLLEQLARAVPAPEPIAVDALDDGALHWRAEYAVMGEAAGLSCPECQGPVWEIREGDMIQFACRIGHRFSPETMMESSAVEIEEVLGMSLRAIEERAALATRLAEWIRETGKNPARAERYARQAGEALQRAVDVREMLERGAATGTSAIPS